MDTKTSCIAREPLSKLEESGSPSILNYNLPQSTTYEVVSFLRIDLETSKFKTAERSAPANDYWDQLGSNVDVSQIKSVLTGRTYSSVTAVQDLGIHLNSTSPYTKSGLTMKTANIPVSTSTFAFSQDLIANKIADSYMPVSYTHLRAHET